MISLVHQHLRHVFTRRVHRPVHMLWKTLVLIRPPSPARRCATLPPLPERTSTKEFAARPTLLSAQLSTSSDARRARSCRCPRSRLLSQVGPLHQPSCWRAGHCRAMPFGGDLGRHSHHVPPGGRGEAYLPAQRPSPVQAARLPAPDVDARRTRHPEGAPGQGPGPAVSLIWSIRDRAVFDRFRTEGRRVRHGVLWCTWIADAEARPPRVAYAIGRAVGGAVVRNRLRRQLRHAVVAEARAAGLPGGWYLIGAAPAAATTDSVALRASLGVLLGRVRDGARR